MEQELIFNNNQIKNDAILGTLEGPCADFIDATRNGRVYDESVWEKVFQEGSITDEMLQNGGIPGEMDHPINGRTETDSERIAILMTERPIKKEGKLWAKFNILNTPLGKIAYTLAKAGFKLGISSRGTGDTFQDANGIEHVDDESYDFRCFDLVLLPSVKSARLNLITEGLDLNKKFNYKKELVESLNNSSVREREIMQEALDNLGIKLEDYKVVEKDSDGKVVDTYSCDTESEANKLKDQLDKTISETKKKINSDENQNEDVDIDLSKTKEKLENNKEEQEEKNPSSEDDVNSIQADSEKEEEVVNDDSDLVEELQNALVENQSLVKENRDLQEKLSVCYAKEANFEEAIQSYKDAVRQLSSEAKQVQNLSQKVGSLTEQLDKSGKSNSTLNSKALKLTEQVKILSKESSSLTEDIQKKNDVIKKLKFDNKKLTEALNVNEQKSEQTIQQLTEQLVDTRKDSELMSKRFDQKLANCNKLVESYKATTQTAINRYIGLQAKMLGINPNEIKNRLDEHYTFNDIDSICESLKSYKLNIESLPYNVSTGGKSNVKMTIQESYTPSRGIGLNDDDSVDQMLLDLVKN